MWTSRGRILKRVRVRTKAKADNVPDVFKEQEGEEWIKDSKNRQGVTDESRLETKSPIKKIT